jgi:succinate dehydrogenase / fumarate reductase, cytochrome b subunit
VFTWPQSRQAPSFVPVVTVTDSGQRRTPKAAKTNSVFKKAVMAVSGIVMLLFLIAHMVGNLHVFQGAESFNDYSHWLREFGEPALPPRTILTLIEIGLLVAVVAHMWAAISLWRQAKRARPQAYVTKKSVVQTYASRTMRWGGVIIGLFVIWHILDLTTGTVNPLPGDASAYMKLVASFDRWYVALFYVLAVVALGFHIRHGLWSAIQTLGGNSALRQNALKGLAFAVAAVVTIGFAIVPLSVMFGLVR